MLCADTNEKPEAYRSALAIFMVIYQLLPALTRHLVSKWS
jgi:hypothetical protein